MRLMQHTNEIYFDIFLGNAWENSLIFLFSVFQCLVRVTNYTKFKSKLENFIFIVFTNLFKRMFTFIGIYFLHFTKCKPHVFKSFHFNGEQQWDFDIIWNFFNFSVSSKILNIRQMLARKITLQNKSPWYFGSKQPDSFAACICCNCKF